MVFYIRDKRFLMGELQMLLSGPFLPGHTYGVSFESGNLSAVFHELSDPSKIVLPGKDEFVMIEGIPSLARRAHGLETEIRVTVPPKGVGKPIRVKLECGDELPLGTLVDEGVRAYTLRKPDDSEPVGALG